MNDIRQLLARQVAWQKERQSLSWPEKIRMAEAIRESVLKFRSAESGSSAKQCAPNQGLGT